MSALTIELNLRSMRAVQLMINYTQDKHPTLVSKNDLIMPVKIDMLDRTAMGTMRQVWLKKVDETKDDEKPATTHNLTSNNIVEFMTAALQMRHHNKTLEKTLIENAELPVPSEYAVMLPIASKDVRRHILSSLIPFQKTREMLLRLEDSLDLPMRCVRVGHMPLMAEQELQQSLKLSHSNGLELKH